MNTNNQNWDNQDNERNDFANNTNSFLVNGEGAINDNAPDNEDDDLYNSDDTVDDESLTDDTDGLEESDDLLDDYDDIDENTEVESPEEEGIGTHSQPEVNQVDRSADTSFSEQTDVTPPNKHEFPSVGPAKTDFESRPQGRTTGRMVGHEPGTEGI